MPDPRKPQRYRFPPAIQVLPQEADVLPHEFRRHRNLPCIQKTFIILAGGCFLMATAVAIKGLYQLSTGISDSENKSELGFFKSYAANLAAGNALLLLGLLLATLCIPNFHHMQPPAPR